MTGFDPNGLQNLERAIQEHVTADRVGGVAWLVARDDDVQAGTAGVLTRGEGSAVKRDSIFRIASMTKPMLAAAALLLVEECRLRLDEPVDALLPELADPKVLVDGRGPIDGATVPARRPITGRDVMTFKLGWGMDFEAPWPQPLLDAMDELGLGSGMPNPAGPPGPDEWIKGLGTLPLLYQPGERWLYNTGADVLGVLVARAAGQPLEVFLRERLFEPLGMADTGFVATDLDRFGTCYVRDPASGAPTAFDSPDGQWSTPPAFPSGGGGMVSTVDDVLAFGRMLLAGGLLPDGRRFLSRAAVEAMTTDQVASDPTTAGGPTADTGLGWGLGVGITVRRTGLSRNVGSYGWDGGLGSSWANDPRERLVATVLTTDTFTSAYPPPAVIQDFWTATYAAFAD